MRRTNNLLRARKCIAAGDESSLVYAALELRLALETLTQKKLDFYCRRYGDKLLKKHWEVNKALRVLVQLDPLAEQSYTLTIMRENGENDNKEKPILVGKHEALSYAWLNKNYNKLGSYLHKCEKEIDIDNLKNYLESILERVEKADKNNLLSDFNEYITFNCHVCEEKVVTNAQALPDLKKVHCQNANCGTTFSAEKDSNGSWGFIPHVASYRCSNCEREAYIPEHKLNIGLIITCGECGRKSQIVQHEWKMEELS